MCANTVETSLRKNVMSLIHPDMAATLSMHPYEPGHDVVAIRVAEAQSTVATMRAADEAP